MSNYFYFSCGFVSGISWGLIFVSKKFNAWLADRRTRIETQKATEHARKVELAEKRIRLVVEALQVATLVTRSAQILQQRHGKQHEAGGIATPEVDGAEYFVRPMAKPVDLDGYSVTLQDQQEGQKRREADTEDLKKMVTAITDKMPPDPVVGDLCELDGKKFTVTYVRQFAQTFDARATYYDRLTGITENRQTHIPFTDFKRLNDEPSQTHRSTR